MNIHNIYRFFSGIFRPKRMRKFLQAFRVRNSSQVLDVGGTPFNWHLISSKPKIILLNLSFPKESDRNFIYIFADGCYLPFRDNAFDVVFCNSVIEHVGEYEEQRLFAEEIRQVGTDYYIQTPNKRFPVEPHLLTPLVHYLPKSWQRRLLRNFTIRGLMMRPTQEDVEQFLDSLSLLDEQALAMLFPDAEIWRERIMGLTKSLIAVRVTNSIEE